MRKFNLICLVAAVFVLALLTSNARAITTQQTSTEVSFNPDKPINKDKDENRKKKKKKKDACCSAMSQIEGHKECAPDAKKKMGCCSHSKTATPAEKDQAPAEK
ncbi:MAG: hypothetical protein LC117_07100 [Bacteroidia bacterium]|nr:hypothetical protein [Bacteroidia bacterium]MCZ2277678.1 hypothetical protein [Bacteroidia bacterium]